MYYLTATDIVKINVLSIVNHAPKEQIGVKDAAALDMSINQPYQTVFDKELYPDIYSKAGILFINLISRHPFFNGNKRTAWISMDVYFKANGYNTSFTDEEALQFTLNVVNFNGDFEELKNWVFDYLRKSNYIQKNPKQS